MISRNLYLNLLFRVLAIVFFAAASGYLIASGKSFTLPFIFTSLSTILTISLISYLNSTNSKIRYFFDSIRNDDSNLFFPENEKNAILKEIYRSMNNVNGQIQKLKNDNRYQEQYFRTLIENIAIGIITFDDKGFILHSNSSAKNLLGTDILTHIGQFEKINRQLYQAVLNIKPFERHLVPLHKESGEIQLSLKAVSFNTRENKLIILSITDIKHELDEKEFDSWIKLIRILMHEIMNSITPITSLSESLSGIYIRNGEPVKPDQVTDDTIATTIKGLKVIKEQGKGLTSFVDSYRQLAKIPEPDKKTFKMAELFNRLDILFEPLKKAGNISLNINLKDPGFDLYADQNLISQVLVNLIRNAFEAVENMPDGEILVIAGTDSYGRKEIFVKDNGPGIPPENLDKIFVPFFTTRLKGSGIGLSISRQIMKVHGGTLKVLSVEGNGTTFCMGF